MLSAKHEAFLAVALQKSFTKASEILFLSQPAISKNIQSLEQEYQAKLFTRNGNKIDLTNIGSLLLARLLEVKNIQDQVAFEISLLRETMQAKGLLKLGASTTVALYILPKVLSGFNTKYPLVQISLLNRNSESVMESLLSHDINIGIIEGPPKNKKIEYTTFIIDNVIAVCNVKSKWARKNHYSLQELPSIPVVLREKGSGTLVALSDALKKNRLTLSDLNVTVRLGGTEALKNFLLESDCLGFVPKISVLKELKNKELKEITIAGLEIKRRFYFIQRKGEHVSELNKAFIKLTLSSYNL